MTTTLAIIGGFTVAKWAWKLYEAIMQDRSGNIGYYAPPPEVLEQ